MRIVLHDPATDAVLPMGAAEVSALKAMLKRAAELNTFEGLARDARRWAVLTLRRMRRKRDSSDPDTAELAASVRDSFLLTRRWIARGNAEQAAIFAVDLGKAIMQAHLRTNGFERDALANRSHRQKSGRRSASTLGETKQRNVRIVEAFKKHNATMTRTEAKKKTADGERISSRTVHNVLKKAGLVDQP